jgi:mono/diheme cytochrome c family protein
VTLHFRARALAARPLLARAAAAIALLAAPGLHPATAWADNANGGISEGYRFSEQDGESLYQAICQSCHMSAGQGAQGAGMYPALAGNARLASAQYPVYTVLHGRKGMPAFGAMLSDDQVAAVANYLRTHLGNHYTDAVTAAEVKTLR